MNKMTLFTMFKCVLLLQRLTLPLLRSSGHAEHLIHERQQGPNRFDRGAARTLPACSVHHRLLQWLIQVQAYSKEVETCATRTCHSMLV